MDTAVITIYCITDDFLKSLKHREDAQCTLSDAEIITVAITAARFYGGNFEHALKFLSERHYMKRRLSRAQFNQRLHRLTSIIEQLFETLACVWKTCTSEPHYILDSFPVAVCSNIRISRCKIYRSKRTNDAFRGYTASKRCYFYGLKVHMLVNADGYPVEVSFTAGSESDTAELKNFKFDLPEGSSIYGDKAYNEYLTEDLLEEALQIKLLPMRKKNSTRAVPAYVAYLQHYFRKQVETTFSLFERMLPKSIHAVTARGFELKVFLFVLACSFDGFY